MELNDLNEGIILVERILENSLVYWKVVVWRRGREEGGGGQGTDRGTDYWISGNFRKNEISWNYGSIAETIDHYCGVWSLKVRWGRARSFAKRPLETLCSLPDSLPLSLPLWRPWNWQPPVGDNPERMESGEGRRPSASAVRRTWRSSLKKQVTPLPWKTLKDSGLVFPLFLLPSHHLTTRIGSRDTLSYPPNSDCRGNGCPQPAKQVVPLARPSTPPGISTINLTSPVPVT